MVIHGVWLKFVRDGLEPVLRGKNHQGRLWPTPPSERRPFPAQGGSSPIHVFLTMNRPFLYFRCFSIGWVCAHMWAPAATGHKSRRDAPCGSGFASLLASVGQQAGMERARLRRSVGECEDICLGQVEAAGSDLARRFEHVRGRGIKGDEAAIVPRLVSVDQRRIELGPIHRVWPSRHHLAGNPGMEIVGRVVHDR